MMDAETVLSRLLRRTSDTRQVTLGADALTISLCHLELDHFMNQVSDQGRGDVKTDRIANFLEYMKQGQLTQAKELSSSALDDYTIVQCFSVHGDHKDFEFNHWDRLRDASRKKHLEKLQNNLQQNSRNLGTTLQVNAIPPNKFDTKKHISMVQVNANQIAKGDPKPTKEPEKVQFQNWLENNAKSVNVNEQREPTMQRDHYSGPDQSESKDKYDGREMSKNTSYFNECLGLNPVYVADEEGEEQGPSPIEEETEKKTDNGSEAAKNIGDVESIKLSVNSSRDDIATQFYMLCKEKFETLVNDIHLENRQQTELIMTELTTIVQTTEKTCLSCANEQIQPMLRAVEDVMGQNNTKKADTFILKEFRRQNADLSLDYLYQRVINETRAVTNIGNTKLTPKTGGLLDNFIRSTTKVIWYMVIQEQPMVLEYICKTREPTDYFEPFNRKTKKLQQVIWPAVRTYDGGSLIRKGVALFA